MSDRSMLSENVIDKLENLVRRILRWKQSDGDHTRSDYLTTRSDRTPSFGMSDHVYKGLDLIYIGTRPASKRSPGPPAKSIQRRDMLRCKSLITSQDVHPYSYIRSPLVLSAPDPGFTCLSSVWWDEDCHS